MKPNSSCESNSHTSRCTNECWELFCYWVLYKVHTQCKDLQLTLKVLSTHNSCLLQWEVLALSTWVIQAITMPHSLYAPELGHFPANAWNMIVFDQISTKHHFFWMFNYCIYSVSCLLYKGCTKLRDTRVTLQSQNTSLKGVLITFLKYQSMVKWFAWVLETSLKGHFLGLSCFALLRQHKAAGQLA